MSIAQACRLRTVVISKQGIVEMPINLLASILDATTDEVRELAIEYGQLISLLKLTDMQGERLQEILDCACDNGALSFWISELDHVIGHETGLLNPDCRRDYDNKKALFKEYFMEFLEGAAVDKGPREIREFLERYSAEKENSQSIDPLSSKERPHSGAYGYQQMSSTGESSESTSTLKKRLFGGHSHGK